MNGVYGIAVKDECDGAELFDDMNTFNNNQFELNQENINQYNDTMNFANGGDMQFFNHGDSLSDQSSPSTNNSNILQVEPIGYIKGQDPQYGFGEGVVGSNGKFSKGKAKTKKQLLEEQDAILLSKDDSELTEEELQLKRKAQNRAAQRAFRERKENKLKNLEDQLNKSEADKQMLLEELELIRKKNLAMQTENELLRSSETGKSSTITPSNFDFPKSEKDFIHQILDNQHHHVFVEGKKNKVYDSPETGEKVLALGAAWDYLLYRADQENLNLDVVEVMSRLKGQEKCHGYGPAYPISLLDKAIEECS